MTDTWSDPRVWVALETLTATKMNEISTALRVLYPFSAVGDILYASALDELSVLSNPTDPGILVNFAGTPAYLEAAAGTALQFLRVNQTRTGFEFSAGGLSVNSKSVTSGYSYATSAERDVPNSLLSVTVDVTSTIVVYGHLVGYCSTNAKHGWFWVNVNGVNYSTAAKLGTSAVVTIALFGVFTGISAGSKTIKLREKPEFGGNAVNVDQFAYSVFVIPE